MNISIQREVGRDPDGTRRTYEYFFTAHDLTGRFYLDTVYERTLAPRKRKWLVNVEYSRLKFGSPGRIADERMVSLPHDVVDEATAKFRANINFAWWTDRNAQ